MAAPRLIATSAYTRQGDETRQSTGAARRRRTEPPTLGPSQSRGGELVSLVMVHSGVKPARFKQGPVRDEQPSPPLVFLRVGRRYAEGLFSGVCGGNWPSPVAMWRRNGSAKLGCLSTRRGETFGKSWCECRSLGGALGMWDRRCRASFGLVFLVRIRPQSSAMPGGFCFASDRDTLRIRPSLGRHSPAGESS